MIPGIVAAAGVRTSSAAVVVNTVAPTVTGTAQQGAVLTGTVGTWTGTNVPDFGVMCEWLDDANTILETDFSNGEDVTYTPTAATVGHTIRLRVTAWSDFDWTMDETSAVSAATATVTAGDPVLTWTSPADGGTLTPIADRMYFFFGLNSPAGVNKISRLLVPIQTAVAGQKFKGGVYNASNTRVGVTSETTLAGGETQMVLDFSPDLTITASTAYKIVVLTDGGGTVIKQTSGPASGAYATPNDTYASGPPSTLGGKTLTTGTAYAMTVETLLA